MRICLIAAAFPPDLGWDGSAVHSLELALGLRELGHEVEVVALAQESQGKTHQDGLVVHRVKPGTAGDDLHLVQTTTPRSRFVLETLGALWQAFGEAHQAQPFDLVHASGLLGEGAWPALFASVPVVQHLPLSHPAYIATSLGFAGRAAFGLDERVEELLQRAALLFSDAIITPTASTAAWARDKEPAADGKIHIVPCAVNLCMFSPQGETAFSRDGRLLLIVRGRLAQEADKKYVRSILAEASAAIPDLRFVVLAEDVADAKPVQDAFREWVEPPAAVTLLGCPPYSLLPALLRSADACLVLSPSDSAPLSWLQAMACRVPLVAVEAGSIAEYLRNDQTAVVIQPGQAKEAAQAVLALLGDEKKRKRLSDSAYNWVNANFDRIRLSSSTATLYQEMIDRFSSPQRARERIQACQALLSCLNDLILPYNRMLYDLLYAKSFEFRVRHWLKGLIGRARSGTSNQAKTLPVSSNID